MKKYLIFCIIFFSSNFSFSQTSKLELFFAVNKHELTVEQSALIDEVMNSNKFIITNIRGFADSTGSDSFNKELSRKRAYAVYDYLRNKYQLDPNLQIEYLGEQHVAGKEISYDRRVEIWYKENSTAEISIPDEKIIPDTPVVIERYELSNIYFIPDKAIVDPLSFEAVDEAAKYLKRFPGCVFEIVGHVNYDMPTSARNNPKALEPAQKLSEERARTIYDFLIERGIASQSMTYKGVGNTQMVFKHPKNDEEKRKNMRVEILISCKK